MQLTRFTDYSLRVLMYLAVTTQKRVTVKVLADHYEISQNHLVKVVHNLVQLGYINSSKGKGGGIYLVKPAEQINLRQLIVQLEPNLTLVECFEPGANHCRLTPVCGLKSILHQSLQRFLENLEQHTLADTLQMGKDKRENSLLS